MNVRDTLFIPPPHPPEKNEEKRACLIIISGTPIGKIFLLDNDNILGRDEDTSVHLDDPSISHHHAAIKETKQGWLLQDLSSLNGTYVDFERVQEVKLEGGEHVNLGSTTLKFMVAGELEKNFYQVIFEMSSRDALTNVLSKGLFLEIASNEIGRALRYAKPLSFCIMDLDHFKKINDRHGHLAGDHVLKEWGQLIQKSIRTSDAFGRLGGEEFGLIITEQNLQQSEQMIQRLMLVTKNHRFIYDQENLLVTFSSGLSALEPECKNIHELMKRADKKLYEAKAAGRNCYRS